MQKQPNPETIVIEITEPVARLDKLLSAEFPGISRSRLQKLVEQGYIKVNGKTIKSSSSLKSGDRVSVNLESLKPEAPSAENSAIEIIYQDQDLMVINKPAGLTVHPAPGNTEKTLVNALLAHCPNLADTGDPSRPGIIHRLDKDTSGLIIIALNNTARDNLMAQFKSRQVTKVYLALVNGKLEPEHGAIEAPIGRHPTNRTRMAIVTGGKPAYTEYRVIKYPGKYTLLEVMPRTGRTHQIRVHLAAIGHPVAGDHIYGSKSPYIKRQFLHAFKVGFNLPSSGDYREFSCDLPDDLKRALAELIPDPA